MMKISLPSWLVAFAVFAVFATLAPPAGAEARVLSGELVVTNEAHNQFRLVGHGGYFTAPAGTPVGELDGKPVQVELGSNGRVTVIRPLDLAVPQVTSSYDIVSGQLVVIDPVRRTFSVAGDTQQYVAESWVDLRPYDRRMVEFRVGANGRVGSFSLTDRGAAAPAAAPDTCAKDGKTYFSGASVCQDGTQFRCEAGGWRNLGTPCPMVQSRRDPGTCIFGSATVAHGSSICRQGTTYRCDAGDWVDVGAPCR